MTTNSGKLFMHCLGKNEMESGVPRYVVQLFIGKNYTCHVIILVIRVQK